MIKKALYRFLYCYGCLGALIVVSTVIWPEFELKIWIDKFGTEAFKLVLKGINTIDFWLSSDTPAVVEKSEYWTPQGFSYICDRDYPFKDLGFGCLLYFFFSAGYYFIKYFCIPFFIFGSGYIFLMGLGIVNGGVNFRRQPSVPVIKVQPPNQHDPH